MKDLWDPKDFDDTQCTTYRRRIDYCGKEVKPLRAVCRLSPTTNKNIHFLPLLKLIIPLKTNDFGMSNQKWSQVQGDNQL